MKNKIGLTAACLILLLQAPPAAAVRLESEPQTPSTPIMVMINNHAAARPQSGLIHADILYECLAEGGITRFLAVYQSESFDGPIGPVRSIRPYFIDIGNMYDAVQVHAGGSPDAYAKLKDEGILHLDEITNAGRYFWRADFRKLPHNLYTSLDRLRAAVQVKGHGTRHVSRKPESVLTFSNQSITDIDGSAHQIDVKFLLKDYLVSYRYDKGTRLYRRYINGEPHVDREEQEQLSAENVVVIGADHKLLDAEGRLEVKLAGGGQAYWFHEGKVVKANWVRNPADGQERFRLFKHEQELRVPGKAHILIVPNAKSFEEHVAWR